jgi:hypothetical protein
MRDGRHEHVTFWCIDGWHINKSAYGKRDPWKVGRSWEIGWQVPRSPTAASANLCLGKLSIELSDKYAWGWKLQEKVRIPRLVTFRTIKWWH